MTFRIYTDTTSRVITAIFSVVTLALLMVPFLDKDAPLEIYICIALFAVLYLAGFLLKPKAYQVAEGRLSIQCMLAGKEYSLAAIMSIQLISKHELKNTYRILGIGGLFSYRGTLVSGHWGNLRSFARGFKDKIVVISLRSGENLLLSPENETAFYEAIVQKINV